MQMDLEKKNFKESCNNKHKETDLSINDVIDTAIAELYQNNLMLKAIDSREFAINIITNHRTLVPIHFCSPDKIEDCEIYIHRAEYYGDCYAGYRIQRYLFDFSGHRVFENDSDNNTRKLWTINELPVTWFFADSETLIFIGNGNIYETFKQDGKKFDTGIFSEKPNIIKRVFLYTPKITEVYKDTSHLYDLSLGLDLDGFKENWEQLPECIDLLQRMIDLDDEDE